MNADKLKAWFLREKRELPWRENPTPYAVWISEVMLQQTQVATVIPYFERWMKRFPMIESLAEASLEEVLKIWEGLGYYSRARNLLEGARYIVKNYGGAIPEDETQLSHIKGLGPYTVGAIRSFAFHKKTAAVDGNVLRVFSRYKMITKNIKKSQTRQTIKEEVEKFLPDEEPWIVNEALIELGATLCGKKVPLCTKCPLSDSCKGYLHGIAQDLPNKSSPPKTAKLYRAVAVITCGNLILVQKGKQGAVMQDLYEFPYLEIPKEGLPPTKIVEIFSAALSIPLRFIVNLEQTSHTFTRYKAHLTPIRFDTPYPKEVTSCEWLTLEELQKRPFSAGHKKIYLSSFLLTS